MNVTFSRRQMLCQLSTGLALGFAGKAGAQIQKQTQQGGNWRSGPDLPLQVQEIYPTAFQGRVHLAGGMYRTAQGLPASDRHVVLTPGDTVWRDAAALPEARHHPYLLGTKDTLFAIGGFTRADNGWTMQTQVWQYDPTIDQWRDGPALSGPRGETSGGALDGNIHLVGGRVPKGSANSAWTDHRDDAGHWVLSPDANKWEKLRPAPTARNSAAGVVVGGLLYVIGGRKVGGGNVAMTEIYNPKDDSWHTVAPMPQAQGGLAAASVNGKIYAFGGEFFGPNGGGVFKEVWEYDPAHDHWRAMPSMPTPRHGLGAVAIGNDIYVIGGAEQASGVGTSAKVEIFTPE